MSPDVIAELINSLKDGEVGRKKLIKRAKKKIVCESGEVKAAIKHMYSKGLLIERKSKEEGVVYALNPSSFERGSSYNSEEGEKKKSSADDSNNSTTEHIPFAEMMRQKKIHSNRYRDGAKMNKTKDDSHISKTKSIDDEIKRLEAELAQSEESSSDSDDESLNYNEGDAFNAEENNRVISLSTLADERIPSLPQNYLPLRQKSKRLKVDRDMEDEMDPSRKKRKVKNTEVSEGLKETVKEMLQNYVARSSEKLPFYCRVCAKQLDNEAEYLEHKKTKFHKLAVKEEQKMSYCKLCRKQFTSPAQLKEHLNARPHRERLNYVQTKQGHRKRNESRGREGKPLSKRQWF